MLTQCIGRCGVRRVKLKFYVEPMLNKNAT